MAGYSGCERQKEHMHDDISIAALMIFAVAPFVASSIRMYVARHRAEESERAWKIVEKFIA
jgi:hypothetical protein